MRITQILVPLDGSETAEAALPVARLLARSANAKLNLVGVSTEVEPAWTRQLYAYLEGIASAERELGFRVQTMVRTADPGDAILMLERELHADLVVMATHGRSGIGRALLGSVADKVSRSSAAPVVLVHPDDHPIEHLRTLLVALDGTSGGAVALATAVPMARDSGAHVVLVRAATSDEPARIIAETYAQRLAASLREANVHAEGRVVVGEPSDVIVSVADQVDADLIVMSTHARRGPVRSLFGSVADEVVRRSRRPVLLVQRRVHHAKRDAAAGELRQFV